MLTQIRVRNYAVIDEVELELGPGMTVLSGETGARFVNDLRRVLTDEPPPWGMAGWTEDDEAFVVSIPAMNLEMGFSFSHNTERAIGEAVDLIASMAQTRAATAD